MHAILSDCQKYRWILGRKLATRYNRTAPLKGTALWVMLNPSTADADLDDPTIRRVREFTKTFGYSELNVVNLYGLRATQPEDLWEVEDPVGPYNDEWLHSAALRASVVILGWGKNAKPARVAEVVEILKTHNPVLFCLGTNGDGSPKHPLYLKKTTPLQAWEQPA